MVTGLVFNTTEELSACLQNEPGPFDLSGTNSKRHYRIPSEAGNPLSYRGEGVVEFWPDDQVVVVRAATPVAELQHALSARAQALPLPDPTRYPIEPSGYPGTVAGTLSMNLPHFFAGQFGSWRDWVLGMTVVVADGTIVKTGSKVVKSVAGYDLHKLFIGARGTLGVIVDVTLRTHPLKAIASLQNGLPKANFTGNCDWIQRTNRTDFDPTRAGEAYADSESSTLWTKLAPSETLHRFPGDWVLRSNSGNDNIQVLNPAERSLMLRLKQKLDPTSKLNPGEFGFL